MLDRHTIFNLSSDDLLIEINMKVTYGNFKTCLKLPWLVVNQSSGNLADT